MDWQWLLVGLTYAAAIGTIIATDRLLFGKLRFSLRTLLIATTLVAVALGVIAWMMR